MLLNKIISVTNQKGGVGKTTLTFNIGKILSSKGKKILLIDNDPQGNLTSSLYSEIPAEIRKNYKGQDSDLNCSNTFGLYLEGVEVKPCIYNENLHILGSTEQLAGVKGGLTDDDVYEFKDKVVKLAKNYDLVLIDCVPSFGVLQFAAQISSDYVIIPVHLDEFSYDGLNKQIDNTMKIKLRLNSNINVLGIAINQVSGSKTKVENYYKDLLVDSYGDYLFDSFITKSAKVKESIAFNQSIVEYNKSCNQSLQYIDLCNEIMTKINASSNKITYLDQ